MSEMRKFLYGQVAVGGIRIQLFRCPFFAVHDLYDFRVAAVHAGAVFQFINGIAIPVDAKAFDGSRIICGERKGVRFPSRFRLTPFIFFRLRCGFGSTFIPHVVLNVFRPYLLDLACHCVEQRQLADIAFSSFGHNFSSLSSFPYALMLMT